MKTILALCLVAPAFVLLACGEPSAPTEQGETTPDAAPESVEPQLRVEYYEISKK